MKNTTGHRTFIAGGTIPLGARVMLSSGKVVVADATISNHIGVAENNAVENQPISIQLATAPGTIEVLAGTDIAAGDLCYPAASGKVGKTGTKPLYRALHAAGADGELIEVVRVEEATDLGTATVVALTSTNGTAAAAVDLAALKTEAEKIGDDVRAIHAALVAKGILAES